MIPEAPLSLHLAARDVHSGTLVCLVCLLPVASASVRLFCDCGQTADSARRSQAVERQNDRVRSARRRRTDFPRNITATFFMLCFSLSLTRLALFFRVRKKNNNNSGIVSYLYLKSPRSSFSFLPFFFPSLCLAQLIVLETNYSLRATAFSPISPVPPPGSETCE